VHSGAQLACRPIFHFEGNSAMPSFMPSTPRSRMSRQQARVANRSAARLSGYLAAGLGATGLATLECEAAVVSVNITSIGSNNQNISGINAGIPGGSSKTVLDFPITGSRFVLSNTSSDGYLNQGFAGPYGTIQFQAYSSYASPVRFSAAGSSSIGPTSGPANWISNSSYTVFSWGDPDLGSHKSSTWSSGSYIGFRARPSTGSTDYNYGYFEVTWNNVSNQFQILSGAYEAQVNTAISVPEPSAIAMTGIGALALGAGAIRRSRKGRKAAASPGDAV